MNQVKGQIIAHAHPNIALIKYWGKRDSHLNLPAVSSLSITLSELKSTTSIEPSKLGQGDQMWLNEAPSSGQQLAKVLRLIERFRDLSQSDATVEIRSSNNFPTAAGLASSASGYAALVVGLDGFYQTQLSRSQLSELARIGSGSAARSIYGGFVTMDKGESLQGEDAVAHQLLSDDIWPLSVAIAITQEGEKSVSSTIGMESTRETSPYYQAWVDTQGQDMSMATGAINARDFVSLAEISEHSCLKMHGLMMSANPGLIYWNSATLACLHRIRELRASGIPVFFTVDAGPQVKAVCLPEALGVVSAELQNIDGVHRTICAGLGHGAWLQDSPDD